MHGRRGLRVLDGCEMWFCNNLILPPFQIQTFPMPTIIQILPFHLTKHDNTSYAFDGRLIPLPILQEPEKIVFHVVTDALNLPAIRMWFLVNPPGRATISIESMDDFKWLPSDYNSMSKKENSQDRRYTSRLNYLRFYLPEVFPNLDKVVLLDHDVVVQRDLSGLWSVDMKGKVNGAVETFEDGETSNQMDMFVNISDSTLAKMFDVNARTWAFGMNVFDLKEWRRKDLTDVYHKWLKLV